MLGQRKEGLTSHGIFLSVVLSLNFWTTGGFAADTYQIDPIHSSLGFAVQHLMVSTVKGEFTEYAGTIEFDQKNPSAFTASVRIQSASIDTRNKQRDGHLKTGDFFDAEKFPEIVFKSKKLEPIEGNEYMLTGDLTIRGITKEISIPLSIAGPVNSPMGGQVIGLSGETTINRQDFGVSWNKALDSGGYVVSDEVKILVNIEASHKPS